MMLGWYEHMGRMQHFQVQHLRDVVIGGRHAPALLEAACSLGVEIAHCVDLDPRLTTQGRHVVVSDEACADDHYPDRGVLSHGRALNRFSLLFVSPSSHR